MYFAWSKTKKTEGWKKLKTKWRLEVPKCVHTKKHSYGVLYQCMPSSISRKYFLDDQTLARTWCWWPRWPSEGQNFPLIMRKLRGYFPLFFWKTKKPVVLSGRACRERTNGLISQYLEGDRPLKCRLSKIFYPKRRQRHTKVNFGDDGRRETSNRSQPFAVCRLP